MNRAAGNKKKKPYRPLVMYWPETKLKKKLKIRIPPGYKLRCYRDADRTGYLKLMRKAGFTDWSPKRVTEVLARIIPDGFFVLEYRRDASLAATAQCDHCPRKEFPYGGELGWVAGDPAHRGKGLGAAVCSAAVNRFMAAGYRNIYLLTDDWRLAALRIYLKLGFVPFTRKGEMRKRWKDVFTKLGAGAMPS